MVTEYMQHYAYVDCVLRIVQLELTALDLLGSCDICLYHYSCTTRT